MRRRRREIWACACSSGEGGEGDGVEVGSLGRVGVGSSVRRLKFSRPAWEDKGAVGSGSVESTCCKVATGGPGGSEFSQEIDGERSLRGCSGVMKAVQLELAEALLSADGGVELGSSSINWKSSSFP